MEWISENWFFLTIAAVFIGMHVFGFGCCRHRKHGNNSKEECDEQKPHSDELAAEENPVKKSNGC